MPDHTRPRKQPRFAALLRMNASINEFRSVEEIQARILAHFPGHTDQRAAVALEHLRASKAAFMRTAIVVNTN